MSPDPEDQDVGDEGPQDPGPWEMETETPPPVLDDEGDLPAPPWAAPAPYLDTLNVRQRQAVDMALRALSIGRGVFRLSGPAGTGKTTTLKAILQAVKGERKETTLVTPTGRAAVRAREVTGQGGTIHGWLYRPVEGPGGRVTFQRAPIDALWETRPDLLVVDEASMVNRPVWNDLYSVCQVLRVPILLVGDGFQLPPVDLTPNALPFSLFSESFKVNGSVELTEVFRQALDSPVLRVATDVRLSTWAQAIHAVRTQLPRLTAGVPGAARWLQDSQRDSVVICHKNATRLALNRKLRAALRGISETALPEEGEPLLVRKNQWDVGVCNGEIVPLRYFDPSAPTGVPTDLRAPSDAPWPPPEKPQTGWGAPPPMPANVYGDGPTVTMQQGPRALLLHRVKMNGLPAFIHQQTILDGQDGELPHHLSNNVFNKHGAPFVRCQLGYALSCHSAQGSEWQDVILMIESSLSVMPENERTRWIYTALTRAKENVYVS